MADPDDALVAVADELYALPPEDFTATRNARAKAAQSDGHRQLADAVRALAKPTAGAWLANLLVRSDPSALQPLLDLGTALRDATARLDGAELRSLSREQPKVVAGLVRQATALAKNAGKTVSQSTARDLEDTLRAAIADADAADQLMSARLANGLQHNGFGLVAPGNLSLVHSAAPAATRGEKETRRTPGSPGDDKAVSSRAARRAEQLEAAERDLADAQAAVDVTVAGQERANAVLNDAEAELDAARQTLERLREEVDRAKFAVSHAEGELRTAKQAVEQANRAARAAQHGLEDAAAKRDRLST